MPIIENLAVVLTLWATIGYLLGSIPFGRVLARMMYL
jgi:glycerol-3-phosphate acyltransferase PlsY